jgi:hypothetical protein
MAKAKMNNGNNLKEPKAETAANVTNNPPHPVVHRV